MLIAEFLADWGWQGVLVVSRYFPGGTIHTMTVAFSSSPYMVFVSPSQRLRGQRPRAVTHLPMLSKDGTPKKNTPKLIN